MEKQWTLTYDGQAVNQEDINATGETAGLADDRVFAELFRLAQFDGTNTARGITAPDGVLIEPAGATGSVDVNVFRAVVGSRTPFATDARKNYRDIRSGLSVAEGAATSRQRVTLAPNATGLPRWDCIYATIKINEPTSPVTVKVKAPGSGVVNSVSTSTHRICTVTCRSSQGTTSATPTWPTMPADVAGSWNVLLGYVRVPGTFGASSTVNLEAIAVTANVLRPNHRAGACSATTATSCNVGLSSARRLSWGTTGSRNAITHYLPATMTGGETLWALIDMRDAVVTSHSHQDGDVLDSRDWRGRFVEMTCTVGTYTRDFAATPTIGTPSTVFPNGDASEFTAAKNYVHTTIGTTMLADGLLGDADLARVGFVGYVQTDQIANLAGIGIGCRMSDGALVVKRTGNPRAMMVLKLEFSGRFDLIR